MVNGASPQVTTDAIFHAVSSKNPRTRYVVGPADPDGKVPSARALWMLYLMPDRLKDIGNRAQIVELAAKAQRSK